MPLKKTFNITLDGKSTVLIPEKYVIQFVDKGDTRVKVKASFGDKSIAFHAALTKHKSGAYKMYFSLGKQKELGVLTNDIFRLELTEDTSKYGVVPCEEFEAVMLSDYEAFQIFETFTDGKKRSIIYAINRYKSSQTRIDKTILFTNNLRRGIFDQKLWLKENEPNLG